MTLAGVHLVRFNEAPALLPGKASTARWARSRKPSFNEAPALLPGKAFRHAVAVSQWDEQLQ